VRERLRVGGLKVHHFARNPNGAFSASPLRLARSTDYQYMRLRGSRWNSNGTPLKSRPTGRSHGIDFRAAAKVFLDPYLIEFDDRDAAGELRFNAIGLVESRVLVVTYTIRGDVLRIISARGAEPHERRKYHEI
jgi:uncharacterized protein